MRKALLVSCVLALIAGPLAAQEGKQYRSQGYVFFAPGLASPGGHSFLHFGGGGDALIYKGLGAGAELGYIFPSRSAADGVGLFSANGSYHFRKLPSGKLVPFVTAGYSMLFRSGVGNLVNFGGGVDYWFRERTGLHLEFRDHIWPECGPTHFIQFRIGLSFR